MEKAAYTDFEPFRKAGFSLVELSIVLVILGLLVGGVMSGQSLIKAAELRSVTAEYNKYQTAINVFKDKYFALPGDMPNATAFWGGPPADCLNTPTTDGTTCDGDGDGMIDYDGGSASDAPHESVRGWQHLVNAGLIEGNYTGHDITSGGYIHYTPGLNVPSSKFSNGMWQIFTFSDNQGGWGPNGAGNYLVISKPTSGLRWHDSLFTPEDAWNIDTKIDDGMPYQGRVQDMQASYTPNCTVGSADDTTYDLQRTDIACLLFMKW